MVEKSTENVNINGYFLSDLSPQDVSWDNFKATTVNLSNILSKHADFAKRGYLMSDCAEWLRYAMTGDVNKPLKLREANFCRDRACSNCSWRRSLRWKATMHKQLPVVKEAYPTHRWIFVTLSVRNCDIHDLRATISMMNKGFNALVRKLKKRIGNIGYIKSVEVTRPLNNTAHPHFHVLFFVPASYFSGKSYLRTLEWVTLWQECSKLDYAPSVDVRAIYAKSKGKVRGKDRNAVVCENGASRVSDDMDTHSAVAETVKYATKSADLIRPDTKNPQNPHWWLYEYLRQIKNLRFISVGGCLKGLIKPEWSEVKNNDELVYVDGDSDRLVENDEEEILIQFNFHRVIQRYWFSG